MAEPKSLKMVLGTIGSHVKLCKERKTFNTNELTKKVLESTTVLMSILFDKNLNILIEREKLIASISIRSGMYFPFDNVEMALKNTASISISRLCASKPLGMLQWIIFWSTQNLISFTSLLSFIVPALINKSQEQCQKFILEIKRNQTSIS